MTNLKACDSCIKFNNGCEGRDYNDLPSQCLIDWVAFNCLSSEQYRQMPSPLGRFKFKEEEGDLEIISFNKEGFEGVHVGILELSKGEFSDIVLCAWAHTQQFHEAPPPALFWNEGCFMCACQVQGILDKRAYTILYPFVCYAPMPEYKEKISVPNLKPEASIPVVKVVPKLLRASFKEAIEEAEKEQKWRCYELW